MQVDEVQKFFKESKSTLLARYRQCAEQALVNAGVLGTSELMVLQAFVLFIVRINAEFYWNWSNTIYSFLSGLCPIHTFYGH